MDHECEGSGREVESGLPSAEAATCPVCGREIGLEGHEVDGDMRFTVEPHQLVVREA